MTPRRYWVADASAVAHHVKGLEDWLNERYADGWRLVSADQGILYLVRDR